MPIKIITTDDITKLDRQIKALKAIIHRDNPKDKDIHQRAILELENHRDKLLNSNCKTK